MSEVADGVGAELRRRVRPEWETQEWGGAVQNGAERLGRGGGEGRQGKSAPVSQERRWVPRVARCEHAWGAVPAKGAWAGRRPYGARLAR